MARYFQLSALNASKFPESAFKTVYYTCTWTYCLYLLIVSGKYDYFQKPDSIWKGENLTSIYVFISFEISEENIKQLN